MEVISHGKNEMSFLYFSDLITSLIVLLYEYCRLFVCPVSLNVTEITGVVGWADYTITTNSPAHDYHNIVCLFMFDH